MTAAKRSAKKSTKKSTKRKTAIKTEKNTEESNSEEAQPQSQDKVTLHAYPELNEIEFALQNQPTSGFGNTQSFVAPTAPTAPNPPIAPNPPTAPNPPIAPKKSSKRKKQKTFFKGNEVDLEQLFDQNYVIEDGTWITNCFLQFDGIQPFYPSEWAQKPTKAYFYFKVFNRFGQEIPTLDLKKRYLPLEKTRSTTQLYLAATGIGKLMREIQTAKVGGFPKVTILAEEKSVTFRKSSETHYYLGMLIADPNAPLSVTQNNDRVAACANCDVMLLRFGFDWVIQRDDLKQSHCPYCKAPLRINYRKGRIIKLDLNLSETGCVVDGGNNQLGVIYHGHAIKTTIWAHGLLYFLKNYQNFFPNKAMGPLKIKLNMANPSEIQDIEPLTLLNIEWRPIELFPEDFMAF